MSNAFIDKLNRFNSMKDEYHTSIKILNMVMQFHKSVDLMKESVSKETQVALTNAQAHVKADLTPQLKQALQVKQEYEALEQEVNSSNLRHVVHEAITAEGLSYAEFADKIGCTERQLTKLLRKGVISKNVLDAICEYFQIERTDAFENYVF